ncbi:MAG: LEA type 2 family protein [Wenzhouxiangellaceae bacterium]
MKSMIRILTVLALLAGLTSACSTSPMQIRSEQPTLEIDSLALLQGPRVAIELLVHNRNDHALELESLDLTMSLEQTRLFSNQWPMPLKIGARGRERITLHAPASRDGAARLSELAGSLAYQLESTLVLQGQRNAKSQKSDYLHPVPGQPDRFR